MKLGFIGIGNMGYAMMKGAMTYLDVESIAYTDHNKKRCDEVKNLTGLNYAASNIDCVNFADVVVLAVKPQYMPSILEEVATVARPGQLFISPAPGVTISYLKKILPDFVKVVRCMPNTPALIGKGISAIALSDDPFTHDEKKAVIRFFDSFGKTVVIEEKQMDMVVPISGSAPAYVYMMIEAMADAGVLAGLSRDIAYELAAQTVAGAAQMVLETGEHPAVLKDRVTSPGGTTIEAVKVLESKGFRSALIDAMDACYKKAKSFGE